MRIGRTHMNLSPVGWMSIIVSMAALPALACLRPASAQTAEATQSFDEGTRFLTEGLFREAVEAYDRAERIGLGSGALFYNRGVAHYRLEEIGQAVRYFERAERLLPDDPRIQHNLDIVAGRLVDRFSQLPVPVWKRLQRNLISHLSARILIEIGLAFYLVLAALVVMKIVGYGRSTWYRRARTVLAVAALSCLATGFTSSIWPPYPTEAVILNREAPLHEGPDADTEVSIVVHEGLVVSTVAEGGEWVLIQIPNGARGWVTADGLGEI